MIKFKASFDDGCQLDLRVADLLEQYGVTDAIFYIPSDWNYVNRMHGDVPLLESEVVDLDKRFSVGSHTVSHPMLTRIPELQMIAEISESKAELEALLGHTIEDFCYPRGYANDQIRAVVRQHYKRARNTLVGNLDTPKDKVWEHTTVHVSGKRRKEYEDTTWQAEAERLLQEAIQRSEAGEYVVYHLWGHSWEIDKYSDWGEFEKLLMRIKEVSS